MKVVFLDRDGVLLFEPQDDFKVDSLSKYRVLPNVIPVLKRFTCEGYQLVMVTNQDDLGSASFPIENFNICQDKLIQDLANEGIEFIKLFVCPHSKLQNCDCRKPRTGMVDDFLKCNSIDYKRSFMVGDRDTDMEFASNIGIRGFKKLCNADFPRIASMDRITLETEIFVQANLDGEGKFEIDTGLKFLDHMLEQFAKHALIDLTIFAKGDLQVDEHHTVEDVAITLGQVLKSALGDCKGIERYGFLLPMDESLCEVALDLGGRAELVFNVDFKREFVGDLPTELVKHFFKSLADNLKATIHINLKYGENDHHKIEAIFKAFARSFRSAIEKNVRLQNKLPSTKGIL
jgi:imidazoleglycerol-phosphate dehydratase/histidinol-phosphatase